MHYKHFLDLKFINDIILKSESTIQNEKKSIQRNIHLQIFPKLYLVERQTLKLVKRIVRIT